MDFLNQLKEYLKKESGMSTQFSDIQWKPSGVGILYVDCMCPEHGNGRLRCKFHKRLGDSELVSVTPMKRLSESQFPWDSTIKNVYGMYSGMAGVSGVANRSVNNSLI
mgnify:CR=1 FL=1